METKESFDLLDGIEERPQGDSNPRCRRERPMSWARLDDRDTILGRARLELATLCLKGRYSTNLS